MGTKIRGLRRCAQRDCMLPLNRDKNGATNVGTDFKRLFAGNVPIRSMSDDEDLDLQRVSPCVSSVNERRLCRSPGVMQSAVATLPQRPLSVWCSKSRIRFFAT